MHRTTLKTVKQAFLRRLSSLGVTNLVAHSRWRQRRLLVLCYHGVSLLDEHRWHPALFISPEQFRARLQLIRDRGYSILPFADAVRSLYRGELPPKALAITFDDGTYDFYARAYPLLQEFEAPATLYLTTYYCRDQRPVFDLMCSYLLWKGTGRLLDVADLLGKAEPLDLRTEEGHQIAYQRFQEFAVNEQLSADEKDHLAERLAERVGADYGELRGRRLLHIMRPEEVREVSEGGIDVQLHTHRHRTPRDHAPFVREIRDNRREIASISARPDSIVHFCYPSGDTDPMFLPWLREEHVATATTCEPGLATATTDALLMPRFLDTSTLSSIEFEGWLAGVSAYLPRRRVPSATQSRG